jgi:hypothetical protein
MKDFTHQNYIELLAGITESGRKVVSFRDISEEDDSFVILRHDVDFSLQKALDMARLDNEAGATSTFFILLTAPYYNPLSEEGVKIIRQIAGLGHECGLHYDCTGFELLSEEQRQDRIKTFAASLADATGVPINSVAQHKPAKSKITLQFPAYTNAYDDKYFKEIAYISDSRGRFRHDDVQGFIKQNKRCQLLIHPIWWTKEKMSRSEIFRQLYAGISEEININLVMEEESIEAYLAQL